MVSTIGFFIMLIGGINAAWVLIWFLMSAGGTAGAKLSKKIGTDNVNTDKHIETGKTFTKELLSKLSWRLVLTLIGYFMYTFG